MSKTLTTSYQLVGTGSPKSFYGTTGYLELYAKYNSYNVTNNTSNVTFQAIINFSASGTYDNSGRTLKIGDNTTGKNSDNISVSKGTSSNPFPKGDFVLGTWTENITHNSDGTKNVIGFATMNFKAWGITLNVTSDTLVLPTIPRKSGLSAYKSDYKFIADRVILIEIARKSSTFRDTLEWSCENLNEIIQTKGANTKIALCFDDDIYNDAEIPNGYIKIRSKYSNTDLMNLIPNWSNVATKPNQIINFKCTTYNENVSLGSNNFGFKYEIYQTPFYNNLSYKVTDILSKTLTGAEDVVIKGISDMQITNNPLKYLNFQDNVVAKTYLFSGAYMGGVTQTSNTYTFTKMLGSIVRSIVTDARGQSTDLAQNPIELDSTKFLEYFTPIITELKTERAESTSSDIAINVKGNFWNENFGAIQNQINLKYRYKLDNDNYSNYIEVNPTISQNEFTFATTLQGSSDKQFTIEFVVSDSTNSQFSLIATEPKGESLFDLGDEYFNVNGLIAMKGTPILNLIYPIGSIYMSVSNVNPSSLFGGVWIQLKDTFLLGAGDFYTAGTTGGEAKHKLTINEIPSHNHGTNSGTGNFISDSSKETPGTQMNFASGSYHRYAMNKTGSIGGGAEHNNMPPYIVVYMWQRIE